MTLQVPGDLASKLASVATSCGATLFMALMTAWQVCHWLGMRHPLLLYLLLRL